MLSPHEFATLMLVMNAPDHADLDQTDLNALLERQLVEHEKLASGCLSFNLTEQGYVFLHTLTRTH